MHAIRRFTFSGIAGIALLSLAACHSSPTEPDVPDPPPGAISCVGHEHFEGEAGPVWDAPTQYAFWFEPADSSVATLEIGVNGTAYHGSVPYDTLLSDTIRLARTSSGWGLAPNDRRYSDTAPFEYSTPLTTTSDSVTLGLYRLFSWTTYYLRKVR